MGSATEAWRLPVFDLACSSCRRGRRSELLLVRQGIRDAGRAFAAPDKKPCASLRRSMYYQPAVRNQPRWCRPRASIPLRCRRSPQFGHPRRFRLSAGGPVPRAFASLRRRGSCCSPASDAGAPRVLSACAARWSAAISCSRGIGLSDAPWNERERAGQCTLRSRNCRRGRPRAGQRGDRRCSCAGRGPSTPSALAGLPAALHLRADRRPCRIARCRPNPGADTPSGPAPTSAARSPSRATRSTPCSASTASGDPATGSVAAAFAGVLGPYERGAQPHDRAGLRDGRPSLIRAGDDDPGWKPWWPRRWRRRRRHRRNDQA